MASGDTLVVFTALHNEPPSSAFATLDTRNSHPVLDFDPSTDEEAVFGGIMPRHYAGGGVTVMLVWMTSTAVGGEQVRWEAQFERHQDDAFDLDGDGFAAVQGVTADVPTVAGEVSYDDIAFTNAQIDGLLVGESFRLKVRRDVDLAADDAPGDAELLRVEIRET